MGYSEVLCTICGMSFNIGRIRTPTEPRSAAWSRFGPVPCDVEHLTRDVPTYTFVDGMRNSWTGECHRDAGCMFTMRKVKDEGREVILNKRGKRKLAPEQEAIAEGDEDNSDDEDWVEQDEGDDEPLEYHSEVDEDDIDMEDVDSNEVDALEKESVRRFWQPALKKSSADVKDEMFPLFYPGREGANEYGTDDSFDENESGNDNDSAELNHYLTGKLGYYDRDKYDVEHIAGPGCVNLGGYSGHDITVEEMRGCQISQCLVPKPDDDMFEPLEDDEDFEKQGHFFLSGLSHHMPSRDMALPEVFPDRHDCSNPNAENWHWNEGDIEEIGGYALPFHPSCFEVYKRASLLKTRMIDVDGLTSWWSERAKDYNNDYGYLVDLEVKVCCRQEWDHVRGTEYLAANPLFVPKLQEIFQAVTSTAPGFSPRNGAFNMSNIALHETPSDLFAHLPLEIRFEILDDLSSKDIAALRLSSRTFRQLPIFYFQKLINREMPWLWEAWPTEKSPGQLRYALWATMTPAAVDAKLQKPFDEVAALDNYVEIVSEEMPELKEMLEELLPLETQAVFAAHKLELEEHDDRKPFFLTPQGTNYFELYTLITRHWSDLKGLQNRRRIWKDCRRILRRIKALRHGGGLNAMAVDPSLVRV